MFAIATLDWVFVGVLLFSMVVGAWRGLVYEVLSLLNWLAAFVLAQWLAPFAAQRLPLGSASEIVRYGAGFVAVFVAALFVGGLVAFLIRKLVAAIGLRPVDRALGALFGALRGVVVLMAVTVVAGMTPVKTDAWWQESVGAKAATAALQGLKPVMPQEFGKYLP